MHSLFSKVPPSKLLQEIEREKCERSLAEFLKHSWKWFDPAPYAHGRHVDVICEYLEAVTRGQIKRLLINIPPRHAKSSILSVAWPAWTWTQNNDEYPLAGSKVQWLFASYAHQISLRDSLKCRRVIESPWYQQHWGEKFRITSDQNTKVRFENSDRGYRLSTSVGGALTGEGGNILVCDDPHNAMEAESDQVRQSVLEWWDTAMSTRLNDPRNGAKVIVMQRLHESDLSGHVLEEGGWEHVCLPAYYETDRNPSVTVLGNVDWRTEDEEPLWPEKYGTPELDELAKALGPYGTAGQLQQSPEPRGGGIIKRAWWKEWEGPMPHFDFIVASLDTAYTEKQENDLSALVLWGVHRDKHYMPQLIMIDAWQERLEVNDLVKKVAQTCQNKKVDKLLIEDKAAGHSVAQEIRRLMREGTWSTQLVNQKGDKIARVYSVQHLFTQNMIWHPDSVWAQEVIDQMAVFPNAKHDDLTDAAIQGLRWLRDSGWALRKEEQQVNIDKMMALPKQEDALYDV